MTLKAREVPLTVALVLGLHLRTTCVCPSFLLECVGTKVSMGCGPFSKAPFLISCVIFFSFIQACFCPSWGLQHTVGELGALEVESRSYGSEERRA